MFLLKLNNKFQNIKKINGITNISKHLFSEFSRVDLLSWHPLSYVLFSQDEFVVCWWPLRLIFDTERNTDGILHPHNIIQFLIH